MEHYVDQLAKGINEPQWPENVNPVTKESSDPSLFSTEVGTVRVVTPTASISTGFSDSEDDDVDDDVEDNSDVEIN